MFLPNKRYVSEQNKKTRKNWELKGKEKEEEGE